MRLAYRYVTLVTVVILFIGSVIYWKRKSSEANDVIDWGPDALFYHSASGGGVTNQCLHGSDLDQKRENRFKLRRKYNLNVCLSDVVPLNRPVPDSRPKGCQDIHYQVDELPSASVVITFHNEWPSLLFRTVYSVIQRTPKVLLKDVVLVDDATESDLSDEISEYIKEHYSNGIVKLIRLKTRQGLIRSRLEGIKRVTGEVVVFLDSHMEVNNQWLEPLLAEIKKDDHVVAEGNLDYINTETLRYEFIPGYKIRYGFDWRLRVFGTLFRNDQLDGKKETDTLPGVVLVGSGFAISVKYLKRLGTYDSGMKIYGGENLELSWRIWLCGGRIVQVPCSQIGHIERDQPYTFPEGRQNIEMHNYKRAVEIWLDDYKKYVYNTYPKMNEIEIEDIYNRLQLKEKLKCKPFSWFLDNIWPELFAYDREVEQYGTLGLRKLDTKMCLDNENYVLSEPKFLETRRCSDSDSQIFALTTKQQLRTTLHCATVKKEDRDYVPWLQRCLEIDDKWSMIKDGQLKHQGTGLCLELLQNGLVMNSCNSNNNYQIWSFQHKSSTTD